MLPQTDDGEVYGLLDQRNIRRVQFGLDKRFATWYGSRVYFDPDNKMVGRRQPDASHPAGDTGFWLDTLYVCEYCFKYSDQEADLRAHAPLCRYRGRAPGRIKYRSPQHTIRRVRGSKHPLFCQCLCLFTKLFLDNKSMYFEISHYEFYLVYKTGSTRPMAFFSKDLLSYHRNNLACILTLPPYQRQHLGTLLMEFSYRLSRAEDAVSGPEQPLSPFGLVGYLKFWARTLCYELLEGRLAGRGSVTLADVSAATGFRIADIISTLKHVGCLGPASEICLAELKRYAQGLRKGGLSYGPMLQEEYLLLED